MFKKILPLVLLLAFVGCSGVKLLSGSSKEKLYSDQFLQQIGAIKERYRLGNIDSALNALNSMNEQEMLPTERAFKRNLLGVIHFAQNNYEKAILNFDLALATSRLDYSLTAQVHLNLASCYYKLGLTDKALFVISQADATSLRVEEAQKMYLLHYRLARESGKKGEELKALVMYLSSKKKIAELKSDQYFEHLISSFFELDNTGRLRFLESFEDKKNLAIAYLSYIEAEKIYYSGSKSSAKDLLSWNRKYFGEHFPEIETLIANFYSRIENSKKINPKAIGVILPLTGDKSEFGKRAMRGIDIALKEYLKSHSDNKIKLYFLDSKASGAVGAYRVKELVEKHQVGAIIGGLFSDEASKEYLEAKKHGVMFFSLSQVFLSKEIKDHLLIEVPGSVESQVNQLFAPDMLEYFGKNGAIVYPNSERGEHYFNEFWRKSQLAGINLTGVQMFEKGNTDFRAPVKKLLGLDFVRERSEERELLSEIFSLEKKRSIRRIQILRPQIDFDWVYVPALPRDALQLIPSFTYFDAFNLNIIGGPSWRSQSLASESSKLGRLFFIGDDVSSLQDDFSQKFIKVFGRRPRLVEMRSYDSLNLILSILDKEDFDARDDLDMHLRNNKKLEGLTGIWNQEDGIWLKDMASLRLRTGKIINIFKKEEIAN